MPQFHRILFPVDFSPASHASVPFIKEMACRFQSELIAIHVVEMPLATFTVPDAAGFDMLTQMEGIRQARQVQFEEFLDKEFSGVPLKRELAQGDPAIEIIACARQHQADLIMMPTRGNGPLRQFLLGSVTAKVLHDADIPVWTSAHCSEAQPRTGGKDRRILCAVDIESREAPVIQWAAAFAKRQNAELRLLHAVQGGHHDPLVREQFFKLAHQGLESLRKSAAVSCEVLVVGGKPEQVVHDVAQDLNADLVVIGRGGIRGILGRLRGHAYSIIRQSPCPVISV